MLIPGKCPGCYGPSANGYCGTCDARGPIYGPDNRPKTFQEKLEPYKPIETKLPDPVKLKNKF